MIGWEIEFLANHRFGHLATVDSGDRPHVLPLVYAYNGERIFSPIEDKTKRTGPFQYSRIRNILTNHRISFIVDDYDEDWTQLAWVQVRGSIAIKMKGVEYEEGVELLKLKYPQYQKEPLNGKPLLIITPHKVTGWRAMDHEESIELEAEGILGKNVTIQVNHPIGFTNTKNNFIYLVNCGTLVGITGKDGNEWEAYLLGVYEPVNIFEGKCIALIHRVGNGKDALVIVPEGVNFTDDQIKAMVDFQERFYFSEIIRTNVSLKNS